MNQRPQNALEKISDVTYDLKIWKGRNGSLTELVYERTGVKAIETWNETMVSPVRITASGQETLASRLRREGTAEHKIGVPLEPASEYFWSVRARFKLDGKVRVTMWSRFNYPNELDNCEQNSIRPGLYYRFRTPQADTASEK
jgi:hypothetical protein